MMAAENKDSLATTTELTKEAFEEKTGVKLSDELWEQSREALQSAKEGDVVWNLCVKTMKEINDLKAKLQEKEEADEQMKQILVLSVSAVAKDKSKREEFRKEQVSELPCRGGFIAQKFYLDFVTAAREVGDYGPDQEMKQKVITAVNDLGGILSTAGRPHFSMLNDGFFDDEGPQSAVGTELFRCAIDVFQENSQLQKHRLRVTHQQHLVTDIQKIKHDVEILRGPSKKRKTKETGEDTGEDEKKSDDRIDVCVWFVHEDESLGACVLAAVEYKPDGVMEVVRKAQADMYGSNIALLHKKPCVVIDIAGGTDLAHWKVSAYGLVQAKFTSDRYNWEKTPLYEGSGAEAIVMVAYGLVKAQASFPPRLDDFGERLGPVVGVIGGQHVYKVYDDAKTRKPNFRVVKILLDEEATMMTSKDEKLTIIRMKKFESDWKQPVRSKVFFDIIEKLKLLHTEFGPHGDIRLANLLSTGHIIDFDFVGAKFYPRTLQSITQDGARHGVVARWIADNCKGEAKKDLAPSEIHDWFSLSQAMRLFEPVDKENLDRWNCCCEQVEIGECDSFPTEDFLIKLSDETIPLQGTGHTPVKKPPQKTNTQTTKRTKTNQSASIPEST